MRQALISSNTSTDRIDWCISYLKYYLQEALMEENSIYEQLNQDTLQDAFTLLSLLEHYRHTAERTI